MTKEPRRIAEPVIRCITVIALAFTLYYLIWRVSTFNPDFIILSLALWLAEAYGLMIFILYAFMAWRLVDPVPPQTKTHPTVDVFIPTYNEPVDVLRATLAGCANIRYPHQTYVLDDGGREEVRALAAAFNCHYIARPTHEGAKAGNLNHALKQTTGELIATLDADNIPLPGFLDDTVGFFDDPMVAVVQGPQLFYNLDSFEHEHSIWHEQRLFFHVILPGKNRTNSAFWCGSPAVVRRSALESIGGVATESVTEDLHTTIRLLQRGYRLVYIDRSLALGLAPATVEDFLGQRFRWAQGAMQVWRKDNPLTIPGLTISQRLSFFASMVTYFDALQRFVLLLIPILVLLTGALPIRALDWGFWVRFVPYSVLTFTAIWLLGRGFYNTWDIFRYDMIKTFTFISALRTIVTGRARPFRVTSKLAGTDKRSAFQQPVWPHWIVIGLSLVAIAIGVVHIVSPLWYVQKPMVLIASIGWTLFNITLLVAGALRLRRASRRATYRFRIRIPLRWQRAGDTTWHPAQSIDLSARGIAFVHSGPALSINDRLSIAIPTARQSSKTATSPGQHPPEHDADIKIDAHVVGEYTAQSRAEQRVSLLITNFASEADAYRYSELVYSPPHLLSGELAKFRLPVPDGEQQ